MTTKDIDRLLEEKIYRPNADLIQAATEARPEQLLPYLIDRFTSGKLEGITVLAMAVGNIARARPALIQPYQKRMLNASVRRPHPGVRRNVLRYLCEIPVLLDESNHVPSWVRKKDFKYKYSNRLVDKEQSPPYVEPKLEGLILDHALAVISDPQEVAAPKAFAMILGTNLCLKYPEISNEMRPIVSEAMKHGTPGVIHRGKLALKLMDLLIEVMRIHSYGRVLTTLRTKDDQRS
jgi:hypothetical protein